MEIHAGARDQSCAATPRAAITQSGPRARVGVDRCTNSYPREARYARGCLFIRIGKKAQGRKELEKVYAEDPNFRDVTDRLRSEMT